MVMTRRLYITFIARSFVAIACSNAYLEATVIAKGDATNVNKTFTKEITSKVFDRATGTIYVAVEFGTEHEDGDNSTNYRLSKATRLIGNQKPQFIPIGQEITEFDINFLTLATEIGDTSPLLAFVELGTTGTPEQKIVHIVKNDGSHKKDSAELKDADGNVTCGIVAIAANKSFIFATSKPGDDDNSDFCEDEGSLNKFGDPNSGIAVVSIDSQTLELSQTDAQGGTTIRAKKLDKTTEQVKIANNVIFNDNIADLYWDYHLGRLYIGLQLKTNSTTGNGAKAAVVARIDERGVMELSNIAPNDAFNATVDTNIVGAITNDSRKDITIKHIHVMHCSTGPSYLIVNGGNGNPDEINNLIFALPLVDNQTDKTTHGTLANKNSTLSSFKFITPAAANSQLPRQRESAVDVGTGPLPIPKITSISDMVVVGDTVYVSINTTPDQYNDSGIFYSQALFDETGKILRWTPWTKRTLPYDAFPKTFYSQGRIAFFDVDAVTGKLWAVEGTQKKAVCSTAWDLGTTTNSLPATLNKVFNKYQCNKGCFSVLDLDQSTRGFDDMETTTTHRYALFGGADKVVFALISEAFTTTTVHSPQKIIEDFSKPENFLTTFLDPCSGCVHVLEYSQTPTDALANTGYFFAGTENGLFVFADVNENGFNVTDLQKLNQSPFITGIWHKIQDLPGAVIDIKTLGNRLYVIMFETSCRQPLKSKLYGIDYRASIDDMINTKQILAESEIGILSKAYLFTGMGVIATGIAGDPLNKEQIILATNNGLFHSNADQTNDNGGIINAQDQDEAMWQHLPSRNTKPYSGITTPDAPIPSTTWPISIEDKAGDLINEHSRVQQISVTGASDGQSVLSDGFVPQNFNALSNAIAFQTLNPITHFWSDGARRCFIIQQPQDPYCINKLLSFPYNTKEWNVFSPGPYVIFDPVVLNTKRFYWIHQIGVSGILMVGTDSGVIALE